MKRQLLLAAAISTSLFACNQQAAEQNTEAAAVSLTTEAQRISYGMGLGLGQRIKQEPYEIDVDAFAEGIRHAVNDTTPLMTEEEIAEEMQAFQQKQMALQQDAAKKVADDNQAQGSAFLAENAVKEGVTTTASGLQYKVITAAEGPLPSETDTVEVHYEGRLINGEVFDSSYERGQTVSFPVTGVIAGWTEALQLMPVGSKWQLYIPADLAYGPRGTNGGPIGPNATLIFDVELKGIKAAEAPAES